MRPLVAVLALALVLALAAAPALAQIAELESYDMGETAEVGDLTYTVERAWWQEFAGEPFLALELIVANVGADRAQIPPFQLFDSEGDRHEVNYSKIVFPAMSADPRAEVRGRIFFHVPQDRSYRLLASGSYGTQAFAYVHLDEVGE